MVSYSTEGDNKKIEMTQGLKNLIKTLNKINVPQGPRWNPTGEFYKGKLKAVTWAGVWQNKPVNGPSVALKIAPHCPLSGVSAAPMLGLGEHSHLIQIHTKGSWEHVSLVRICSPERTISSSFPGGVTFIQARCSLWFFSLFQQPE